MKRTVTYCDVCDAAFSTDVTTEQAGAVIIRGEISAMIYKEENHYASALFDKQHFCSKRCFTKAFTQFAQEIGVCVTTSSEN